MSWLYNGGHGLMECTLSLSGEVAKVHSLGFRQGLCRIHEVVTLEEL